MVEYLRKSKLWDKGQAREQLIECQRAALTARQPVLALHEDTHWIDPSTLELLVWACDECIRELPVLVLITFPETSHAYHAVSPPFPGQRVVGRRRRP